MPSVTDRLHFRQVPRSSMTSIVLNNFATHFGAILGSKFAHLSFFVVVVVIVVLQDDVLRFLLHEVWL